MEIAGALAFLYVWLYRRETPWMMILVGGFAAISLILTTAKVNIAKVMTWCIFLLLYLNIARLKVGRASVLAVITVILGFGLFVVLSTWGAEEFESSTWYRYVPVSGYAGNLLYAYIYNTGQIPTLDQLLHDPGIEFQWGKLTLLPIAKVMGIVIPEFTVPSHIGTFYPIPFPFNVATYLDVMYKDFGLVGTLVLPFMLGWLISAVFIRFLRTPSSFWFFYLNIILSLWINASVSAAGHIKPVYWFQIGVGYILAKYVSRPVPKR
jgi:oligosaccharide repeat unit polymerase